MLIKQLNDAGIDNVKTENLKFRTDIWDQIVDGWLVTQ